MGGSSKAEKIDPAMNAITPVTPAWLAGATPLELRQTAPGQLSALAGQLARAGYGTRDSNVAWMDQFYDPVSTLKLGPPPALTAPGTTTQPTTGVKASDGPDRMVLVDGRWVPASRARIVERRWRGR